MPNKKQSAKNANQNLVYYIALAGQRVSLLLAAASTIILWATLIAIAHGYSFTGAIQDVQYIDINNLNQGAANEISALTGYAIIFGIIALIASLALVQLPQIRSYRKHIIFDGVIIAGFCLIFSVFAQAIFRFILANIV